MSAEKVNLIISVVTADQSVNAAKKISKHLNKNHIYLDGNSVSPGTKIKTNKIIKFSGCYHGHSDSFFGHKTKMLVAGPNKTKINKILKKLKFNYEWENSEIGKAAVVKMLRSNSDRAFAEGETVHLAIRPEKIGIHAERPDGPNTVQGKVLDIAYLGNLSTYHVQLPNGQIIKAQTTNTRRISRYFHSSKDDWEINT